MSNNLTLSKRISLNLLSKYKKAQSELHQLNYLFWECTLTCNLNCQHCGSDCTKQSDIFDLPASDFLNVLDNIKEQYNPNNIMVVITGGEPLMRKDLPEIGMEIYKKGFPWGIVSNGYNLNRRMLDSLQKSGIHSITISLDGLENSHNWLRGKKDSFVKALDAILLVSKNDSIAFDVVTCCNQKNIVELELLKELLISKSVKKWRLFSIFPKGRAKNEPELQLSDSQFIHLMEFIIKTNQENKIQASFGCEGFLGKYENEVRNGYFYCRAGISVASVLCNGDISACPSLRGDYIQGNIYNDNFMDIWNKKYHIMRDRSWTKVDECADCEVYKWCNGSGLHLRDESSGKLLTCHYKKTISNK